MVVGKDTTTGGVHHLLIADFQELPFPDVLDTLYLLRGDVYLLVSSDLNAVGLHITINPADQQYQQNDSDSYQYRLQGNAVISFHVLYPY